MKQLGKFALIEKVAHEYEHFPFRQQMYAICTVAKALNCQVFFEMVVPLAHEWTVYSASNRKMGKITVFCKNEEL